MPDEDTMIETSDDSDGQVSRPALGLGRDGGAALQRTPTPIDPPNPIKYLLHHVPAIIREECVSMKSGLLDTEIGADALAAVHCPLSSSIVFVDYFLFNSSGRMNIAYNAWFVRSWKGPRMPGTCTQAPFNGERPFHFEDHTGRVLCYETPSGGHVQIWADDETHILVLAQGWDPESLARLWRCLGPCEGRYVERSVH
jgi:hypothetical protein